VPWYPHDLDAWSVRWVLMHLVAETARHAGHADIVREAVDGGTSFPIIAAAGAGFVNLVLVNLVEECA
jgi:hypothetical protein